MVILIWKNVARLFQNVLVQPQIIIACLGTLPLLKNQGVRVWWGAGLRTAVISSAAQWLCNWENLKRHPYTEIHCLYQQGGKTGEVNQWNVEYGLQSDQEDIHCSSNLGWWLSWFFPSNLSFAQRVGWLHHQVQPNFSTTLITVVRQIRVASAGCNRIEGSPEEEQWVSTAHWAGVGPAIFNHTINTPMHSVL